MTKKSKVRHGAMNAEQQHIAKVRAQIAYLDGLKSDIDIAS
jgi:hypothetical protein